MDLVRGILAILTWCVASSTAWAQLIAVTGPVERPVELRSVDIRAQITGRTALTTLELRFFNPNARVLEGELTFPLADGQTITGFALDIDGVMRDAVPVDKPRAQAVFEDITRARIDPALLQVTQGNNFKLRVYPLPPGGERIVRLRILESVPVEANSRMYRLPLGYARNAAVALRVHTRDMPRITGLADTVNIESRSDGFVATVARAALGSRGIVEVALPASREPATSVGRIGDRTYFYTEVPFAPARIRRPAPKVIGIAWDSSGSGANRDRAREFALLDAYFDRVREVEVRLVRVRDRAESPQPFRIRAGDWRALRAALEATPYDGGTDLGAYVAEPAVEEVLFFSDGLATFGEGALPRSTRPMHTILAAPQSNAALLRHIARISKGRFVDLERVEPTAAAADLLAATDRLIDAYADGATEIIVDDRRPDMLAIAGVLTAPRTNLQLTVGHGAAKRNLSVAIDAAAAESALAPVLWARTRIDALEGEHRRHRAEIRRIGIAFGLPTRETSLLVLDRVEDYVRHEIDPPAPLRADYERLRAQTVRIAGDSRRVQLERVAQMLAAKRAWWNRDYPKDTPPPAIAKNRLGAGHLAQEAEARADHAPRPLAAAPESQRAPAAPPPAAGASRDAEKRVAPSSGHAIAIRLKPWSPDAPYARRLRDAARDELYRVYLDERADFATSTAFFLDAADLLFAKGLPELGVRVLSNLAEMELENRHILRILGHRLMQAERPGLAVTVFRRVLELAPNEPQSYRDLGLAHAAAGDPQKAIDALHEVVVRPWHGRFPEIELIALAELNAIRATAKQPLDVSRIDPRLLVQMPLDLRAVLTWDADNTDIDLWVTDPNGEKTYYGSRFSYQGARMSPDFTGGYGPEEFSLRQAKPGKYKVEANFYGHRQQIVAGATTLQLWLATRFGTSEQKDTRVTLRLAGASEVVFVGEFEVGERAARAH